MVYATHVAMQGWGEAVWQSICMKREMGVMAIIVKMSFFRDILTWLLFSLIIIVSFSVGGRFYSWQAGETSASCFSVVGIFVWMAAPVVDTTEFDLAGGNENATIGDPDWNTGWTAAREVYEVVYYTLLMIVLINLLIAMMSTTYSGLKRRGRKKHSQIQCVASLVFHAYLGIPSEIPRVRKCFTAFVSLGVITRVRKCFGHSYLNLWVFSGRTRRVEADVHVDRPRVLRGGKLHPLPLNMFESLINMVAKTFIDAKTAKWINEPF